MTRATSIMPGTWLPWPSTAQPSLLTLDGLRGQLLLHRWDVARRRERDGRIPNRFRGEGGSPQRRWAQHVADIGEAGVRVWKPDAPNAVESFPFSASAGAGVPRSFALSRDGRYVAAAAEKQITVWDVREKPCKERFLIRT